MIGRALVFVGVLAAYLIAGGFGVLVFAAGFAVVFGVCVLAHRTWYR